MARSRARLGGRRVGERGAADARHVGARHLTKLLLQQRVAHANAQLPHRAGPGRRQPQHMNTIGDFSLAALPHGRTATSQWAFGSQLPGASGPRRSGAAGAELQGRSCRGGGGPLGRRGAFHAPPHPSTRPPGWTIVYSRPEATR